MLEWVAISFSRGASQQGMEPRSPTLQVDSLPAEPPGKLKNTGAGSLSLLRGIIPTQESNQGLLHWQVDSLRSEPSGKPHDGILSYNPSQANEAHTVCMNLGNVVLSEISQTQKQPDIIHLDQVCSPVIPFLPHSTKKNKTKQKCSDENRSVVVRGWDHGKVFLPKPMRECFRAKETFLSILCFQINLLKSSHLVLFKKRLNFVCTKISISYVFRKIIFIVITEMLL